ncbi:hypothetical protein ACH5RR_008840 [Cinchona calisaya]|uniref:Uncharacterized protein n=1 Tax=Cinchona calisaya TaxID=153742 RepID=A0ABD3AHU9_9GENT
MVDDDPVRLTSLKRSYQTFLGFDESSQDLERNRKVALKAFTTAKEHYLAEAMSAFDNANIEQNEAIAALQEATKIVKEASARVKAANSRLKEVKESFGTAKSRLNKAKQDYTKALQVLKNTKMDDRFEEHQKHIIQLAEQEIQLEEEKEQQIKVFLHNKKFEIEDEDDVKAITYLRAKTGLEAYELRINNCVADDQKQKLVDLIRQEGLSLDDEA